MAKEFVYIRTFRFPCGAYLMPKQTVGKRTCLHAYLHFDFLVALGVCSRVAAGYLEIHAWMYSQEPILYNRCIVCSISRLIMAGYETCCNIHSTLLQQQHYSAATTTSLHCNSDTHILHLHRKQRTNKKQLNKEHSLHIPICDNFRFSKASSSQKIFLP